MASERHIQFSMESQTEEPKKERKRTTRELLVDTALPLIDVYKAVLNEDVEDLKTRNLSEFSINRITNHQNELDILAKKLVAFRERPGNFVLADQRHKALQTERGARNTFSARIAAKGENIPHDPSNAQMQLNLHANIAGAEDVIDMLYSLGRNKEPQKVLEDFFRQSQHQVVSINTVAIYQDVYDHFKITPQAGLQFKLIPGENDVRVGGLTYVGTQDHVHELPNRISKGVFAVVQRDIIRVSGFKPKKNN